MPGGAAYPREGDQWTGAGRGELGEGGREGSKEGVSWEEKSGSFERRCGEGLMAGVGREGRVKNRGGWRALWVS